jgi:two-component system, response regulator PdtaR
MKPPPTVLNPVVLVVEDETFVRMLAVDVLEDEGFTVVAAATADEAWSILEARGDIGVLFTDVNMPGDMDGLTLAARVAERWPRIRLVVTSGRKGLSDHEMPDHGRFVQKPYRQSELMSAIAQAG